jgi:DNA-binding response OmpR family regulator
MARVVIVDPSFEAFSLCAELRVDGLDVTLCARPDDALLALEQDHAELVFVDLMLPGTTGLAFARLLRERMPSVRVVLTGVYHLNERQLSRSDCGAVGFVPKPYSTKEVAEYLGSKAKLAHAV